MLKVIRGWRPADHQLLTVANSQPRNERTPELSKLSKPSKLSTDGIALELQSLMKSYGTDF